MLTDGVSRGAVGLLALWLASLAAWSLTIGHDDPMRLKGAILAAYALGLAVVAWRAKPRLVRAVLLGMLVVLLLGEGLLRVLNPPPEDPDYRAPAPYVMFRPAPHAHIEAEDISLGPLGYRDTPSQPKPPDEYRMIMLGGSAVFNGSPRAASIPGALEAALRRAGRANVRVYNWGVYSAVSGQELAALLFAALDYQPDMILVYNGANDLTLPYVFDPRPGYPFDFMATEGARRIIAGEWSLFDLYALLLRPSALGYAVFQFEIEAQITGRAARAAEVGAGSAAWREALAQTYADNLARMCQLTRAYDVELQVVLQPMIFFKEHLAGDEPIWAGAADFAAHTRAGYDLARGHLAELSARFAQDRCTFRDGSRLLARQRAPLFVDPVHLTDEGRGLVAERLAAWLMSP